MASKRPPERKPASAVPTSKTTRKSAPSSGANASIETQLQAVIERLNELEAETAKQATLQNAAKAAAPAVSPDAERYWLIASIQKQAVKGGVVAFGGDVITPTGLNYLWQKERAAKDLFKHDWTALDRTLAALGHPVRLTLLQTILHGRTTKAELENIQGLGTTGQLYHHLKILEDAGWVRSLERGVYGVPGERVVPLLTMLSAAMG